MENIADNVNTDIQCDIDYEKNAKYNTEIWNSVNSIAPLDDSFIKSLQEIEQLNKNSVLVRSSNTETKFDDESKVSIAEFLKVHQQLEADCVENDFEENQIIMRKYCQGMETYFDSYLSLTQQISSTVNDLMQLEARRKKVCDKTNVLDVTSRKLVFVQAELKDKNDTLSRELGHFLASRIVSQRISSSQFAIGTKEFYDILDKIDDGIAYMLAHTTYKQSEFYLSQYKFSLSVVLTLIKTYVTNVLEQATSEAINSGTQQVDSSSNTQTSNNERLNAELDPAISYYYGKFQAVSYKIQPIIRQIETRCEKNKEYENLLNEIQQIYVEKRYELMNDSIGNSIRAVAEKNKNDRSLLFRTSCSLFMLLCQDEHQLYFVFFTSSTKKLQEYLSSICSHLYDTLRPCVVHIEHIEILCELCSILKFDVLVNVDYDREALEAFGNVVMELLRDIQERLVFRSHIYFRIDILSYTPSGGDLAYPDKLQMMMNIVTSNEMNSATAYRKDLLRRTESSQSVASSSISQHKPMSITDLQGMWYPTIRRTLQCLSRLYRCVDVQTFQGLSQEAISFCVISISNAGALITQRKSPLDGDLFQIKHLLILREQIAAFQVDFTARETTLDFTKVKEAAVDLMHRKNLFKMDSNNAILKFLLEGTPQVKEHLLDSKKDADVQLKKTCQHLIAHVTNLLIDPLQQLNQRIQDYRKLSGNEFNLQKFRTETWTDPETLAEIVNNVKRNIKTRITPIQNSMTLYIHNRETESILFRPIKNNIIGAFVQLEQLLSECLYEWNELLTISCPTADQVSLMLSSVTLLNAQQQQQLGNAEPVTEDTTVNK